MPTTVTAAPPTPNGDLHLGHLSGPYSAADIYARARRLEGEQVRFVTGADTHQSYVLTRAIERGVDPVEMAGDYAETLRAVFRAAGFALDAFVIPQRSPVHREMVRDFVTRLYQTGKIVPRTGPALHCPRCDRYLFEAHVSGRCPHCGADSDGNSCEECAFPNQCVDLGDPVCNRCGATPETRQCERLVFPLDDYAERLRSFHASVTMSAQLEELCDAMLATRLPDIPVTHPTDWGIPVPVPGFTDQRVYVWAEMVPGYFAALRSGGAADWRAAWNASSVVQFFGFDNGYFHAILFPALMMAYDAGLRLPSAFVTNEFLELDREKFSKSRAHAIWAESMLGRVPGDVVRFALAYHRPEAERTSFTWDGLRRLVDEELAGRWQGWLSDLFGRLGSLRPHPSLESATLTPSQEAFVAAVSAVAERCWTHYSARSFSPAAAVRFLIELVRLSRAHAAANARTYAARPGSSRAGVALALEAWAALVLAQSAYPIMPEFGRALWSALRDGEPRRVRGLLTPTVSQTSRPVSFFAPLPPDVEIEVAAGTLGPALLETRR